jgi:hypothetical protein
MACPGRCTRSTTPIIDAAATPKGFGGGRNRTDTGGAIRFAARIEIWQMQGDCPQ